MSRPLVIKRCPLFMETMEEMVKGYGPKITELLASFIKSKMADPTAPYGSSDKANPSGTPAAIAVPKIRHAHLTHDISVFYTVSGSNPAELRLYAVYTHAQSGTSRPPNPKKQASTAKRMGGQTF